MDKTKDTEKKLDYPELKEPFSYRKLFNRSVTVNYLFPRS